MHGQFIGRRVLVFVLTGACFVLAACGGSSSGGSSAADIVHEVPIVMDAGPAQIDAVNSPFVTVTVCAPGNAAKCQAIDHVLVDTGSTGFRVLASVLGNGVNSTDLVTTTDVNGNAVVECTQFADGYTWGPVKHADLRIGGEIASNVPIQVLGDPAYPSNLIPAACINIPGAEEDSVAQFGANAVLGVGNYIQDCGGGCTDAGTQDGSAYNICTNVTPMICEPVAASLAVQVTNPVALFAADNNGVQVEMASVDADGAATAGGTLVFGIGTKSDNALGSATVYALDPDFGTLFTMYAGTALNRSFIDTGSNGYFFPDASIPVCTDQVDFFCPKTTLAASAQIEGLNGSVATIDFAVQNADAMNSADAVEPDLAGPQVAAQASSFDWGLPFFIGRRVVIAFEGTTLGSVQGPADAF
jgi:predicted aspartyl protease